MPHTAIVRSIASFILRIVCASRRYLSFRLSDVSYFPIWLQKSYRRLCCAGRFYGVIRFAVAARGLPSFYPSVKRIGADINRAFDEYNLLFGSLVYETCTSVPQESGHNCDSTCLRPRTCRLRRVYPGFCRRLARLRRLSVRAGRFARSRYTRRTADIVAE